MISQGQPEPPGEPVRVMRIIARLNVGGPSVHVTLLTAGLRRMGFETMLVSGVLGEQEGDMSYLAHDAGIEPVYLPTLQREISLLGDLRTMVALVRLMRRYRPQIVHTHTAKAGLVGRIAARLCGVPVVVHTFHGHVFHGYFGRAKSQLFVQLERIAARFSDVILTISEKMRDDLLQYGIAHPDRIQVLPLGLDLQRFTNAASLRGVLRAELNLSTDTPLVGIIGRLVPVKNHELFLEAARQVAAIIPEAHFAIVGGGERLKALQALASDLALQDRVHFTGWRQDLPAVFGDLDAVVISSRNEGTPVSLIEAMAAGVPVISTAVGGVPDVLQEGRLGAMVAPGDAAMLAQAIVAALRSPDADCLQAARDRALREYGVERLLADTQTLYVKLLKQKGL